MAQYFLSAEDFVVGDTLVDIPALAPFDAATDTSVGAEVKVDVDGDKYFEIIVASDKAVQVLHGLTLTYPYEIQLLFKSDGGTDSRVIHKGFGGRTQRTAKGYNHRPNLVRMDRYLGGGNSILGTLTKTLPNKRRVRIYETGPSRELSAWAHTDPAPVSPDIVMADSEEASFTGDKVGFMCWSDRPHVYWIGIGTDGDPAPTGPVSAVATPINLGATNILPNSVRFTWEQG